MPTRIPFRPADQLDVPDESARERAGFYSSRRWRKLRERFLRAHPVCQTCEHELSNTVHHIEARRKRPDLAFVWSNLKAMCGGCHSAYELELRQKGDVA